MVDVDEYGMLHSVRVGPEMFYVKCGFQVEAVYTWVGGTLIRLAQTAVCGPNCKFLGPNKA